MIFFKMGLRKCKWLPDIYWDFYVKRVDLFVSFINIFLSRGLPSEISKYRIFRSANQLPLPHPSSWVCLCSLISTYYIERYEEVPSISPLKRNFNLRPALFIMSLLMPITWDVNHGVEPLALSLDSFSGRSVIPTLNYRLFKCKFFDKNYGRV
jgi:hypothetical protein